MPRAVLNALLAFVIALAQAGSTFAQSATIETAMQTLIQGLNDGDLPTARTAGREIEARLDAGEQHPEAGPGELLAMVGQVLQTLNDVETAIDYFDKAAARAQANGNLQVRLEVLYIRAHAILQTERYSETATNARALIAEFLRHMDETAPPVRELRSLEGLALYLDGQHDAAIAVLRPLYEANIAIDGAESHAATVSGRILGQTLYSAGRADEAVPLLRNALQGVIGNQGEDHPDTLSTKRDLGLALRDSGALEEAEAILSETLEQATRVLEPADPLLVQLKAQLARTYKVMDRYWAFRQLNEEVMQSLIVNAEPDVQLSALFALADQALAALDHDTYENTLRAIIALVESDPELPQEKGAEAMATLGQHVYLSMRDDEAETLLTEARDRLIDLKGPDAPETLSVLATISQIRRGSARNADVLRQIGRRPLFGTGSPDDARITTRDIEIYRSLALDPAEDTSRTDRHAAELNYGELLREAGRFDDALALAERLLQDGESEAGSSREALDAFGVTRGHALKQLRAEALAGLQRYDEALGAFDSSLDDMMTFARWSAPLSALGVTEIIQVTGRILGERYAKVAWEARGQPGAPDDQTLRRMAFEAVQVAGFNAASRAISRSNARLAAADPTLQARISRWETLALDRTPAAVSTDTAASEQRDTALELASIEAEIEAAIPGFFASHVPNPVALEDVAGTLSGDEALILFMPAGGVDFGTPRDHGLVFAVTRDASAWARLPLSEQDLRLAIARLHMALDPEPRTETIMAALRAPLPPDSTSASASPPVDRFDFRAAHDLYLALFGAPEIAALIETKPTWLLVPQGATMSTPFAALPATHPPKELKPLEALRSAAWLGQTRALSVLPSVASLVSLRTRSGRAAPTGALAYLGIGDPDFKGDETAPVQTAEAVFRASTTTGAAEGLAALPRLPGTRREVETLAALFPADRRLTLLGSEAREGAIRELDAEGTLSGARILHFATHGLVSGAFEGLAEPALALSPSANRPGDDGLLTASEAAQLNLDVEWIILSACDTAEGIALGGDGVGGLAQGFLQAGAQSLMVSHWRVDDAAAARLTTETVALTTNGVKKAEALRRAMAALAADTSRDGARLPNAHPSVWAPFFVIGAEGP